ncbi:MAG: 50S ribosomal protein L32e [Candidatus Micrarchaeota archaeon]|nr:50S ribosomal protein L32e [Candidatus Micrarchaeota archaeon]
MVTKKKHKPTFARPNYGRKSRERIKANWRRPRGIDNKKGFKWKYMGASPSIGYGADRSIFGFHPSGKKEVLVENMSQLEAAKECVIRIAGGVGGKLRAKLVAKAAGKKLKVVNPN